MKNKISTSLFVYIHQEGKDTVFLIFPSYFSFPTVWFFGNIPCIYRFLLISLRLLSIFLNSSMGVGISEILLLRFQVSLLFLPGDKKRPDSFFLFPSYFSPFLVFGGGGWTLPLFILRFKSFLKEIRENGNKGF